MSRLDQVYRSILLTKFFVKGWGNPEKLKRILEFRKVISNRETCKHLVSSDYPVYIDKEDVQKECTILEGHMKSPILQYLPDVMPKESENAKFQVILPNKWNYKHAHLKPVCLHLAGTGDHYYWRRRTLMARPLLKEKGIASIILENPYYGVRKPKQQLRSSLHNVSDLFVMGGALVLESLALFHWCERQGYGPLGITGISMGGFMASLAGANWHRPLSLVPCLSWSTASAVFCQGVMSGAIPWQLLEDQFTSDKMYNDEVSKLIHSPEKKSRYYRARQMGQEFVRNFPESLDKLTETENEQTKSDSGSSDKSAVTADDIVNEESEKASDWTETPLTNNNACLQSQISQTPAGGVSKTSAHFHTMSSATPQKPAGPPKDDSKKSKSQKFIEALRFSKLSSKKGKAKSNEGEALEFMKGVMDECTHLGNFSVPLDPELIIIIAAKMDAYVPRDCSISLEEIWPGAEVRYIDSGHISAFLFKQDVFRDAIADSFDRLVEKYYKDGYPGKN